MGWKMGQKEMGNFFFFWQYFERKYSLYYLPMILAFLFLSFLFILDEIEFRVSDSGM